MPLVKRLHLDEVVTSFPELGPTIPDGGYSWLVLFGVFLIQMTVPSVLSMYGTTLGYIAKDSMIDFYLWNEQIILTPVLFIAFWSLADPWAKTIVTMASIPRLVGIIGVILLSVGVLASGYLATGGAGAYLANSSAGAVMGIGASFVILQSDYILRKYFRRKLLLALALKNIGTSVGFVLVPTLTYYLLNETDLQTGLLLSTIIFIPTAFGTLLFKSPVPQQASPYRLLLSAEEDNEIPIRMSPEPDKRTRHDNKHNGMDNLAYGEDEENSRRIFSEGSNIYAYQEPDDDVDLFVNPVTNVSSKWKQEFQVFRNYRFWAAVIGWTGMKASVLLFWITLPALILTRNPQENNDWLIQAVAAGFGTFVPSVVSYKVMQFSSQHRRLYFGLHSLLSGTVLLVLSYTTDYSWMMMCALLGGISIGSIMSCQDIAVYDVLGTEIARCASKVFSTIVGLCLLTFCFINDTEFSLQLASFLQIFGGLYWISSPVFNFIKTEQHRLFHIANRTNRDQT